MSDILERLRELTDPMAEAMPDGDRLTLLVVAGYSVTILTEATSINCAGVAAQSAASNNEELPS